jgi:dipicolinate synthase subunit A
VTKKANTDNNNPMGFQKNSMKRSDFVLTGKQVVFIGGDARQLEIIEKFIDLDANVTLIGFENFSKQMHGITKVKLTNEVLRDVDAVILPAVGSDHEGFVESIFSNEKLLLLGQHLDSLPKNAKIYTGMAKPYLKKLCTDHNIDLVELFQRDDIAIYNSIPTAEGALMMAIQHTDITIHGSQCMVLGFGRTGFTVARMLQNLGAHTKVGVQLAAQFARAFEMGFQPFYTTDLQNQVSTVDIIFNTVPEAIITAHIIARIPSRTVIIDLASKPGGTDFRFAEKRGIKAILAPSLPGLVAPQTAGRFLANSIALLIQEQATRVKNEVHIRV